MSRLIAALAATLRRRPRTDSQPTVGGPVAEPEPRAAEAETVLALGWVVTCTRCGVEERLAVETLPQFLSCTSCGAQFTPFPDAAGVRVESGAATCEMLRRGFAAQQADPQATVSWAGQLDSPPPTRVSCPHCGRAVRDNAARYAHLQRCPGCRGVFRVELEGVQFRVDGTLQRIGEFEILETLGCGGMGIVFKARRAGADRPVALKLILGEATPGGLSRFYYEGETLARLRHRHIVRFYEMGQQAGVQFLALEYVEGGSLEARLKRGPIGLPEAVSLTKTLAGTLSFAHSHGVIHRDLKPANVLLDADGTPKISDFGLVKRVVGPKELPPLSKPSMLNAFLGANEPTTPAEATTRQEPEGLLDRQRHRPAGASSAIRHGETSAGVILGTPHYMAPEQASGHSAGVGLAADIHALGVMLYQMLTGRLPFTGDSVVDVLRQVRQAVPVPPRQAAPHVPEELEAICLRCLRKAPSERFASGATLAKALHLTRLK